MSIYSSFSVVYSLTLELSPSPIFALLFDSRIASSLFTISKVVVSPPTVKVDDLLETFFLNLLYTGNMSTFAPVSFMDRTGITVIRPLIYTEEKDTKRFIKRNNLQVMPKCCPMDGNSKREDMKELIYKTEKI